MLPFVRPRFLALAAFLVAAPATAAEAPPRLVVHPRPARLLAAPLGVAVAPGLVFETPFSVVPSIPDRVVRVPHDIGPDGTYEEHADLVRSIDGTPCGQACTRRALVRWGYAPAD